MQSRWTRNLAVALLFTIGTAGEVAAAPAGGNEKSEAAADALYDAGKFSQAEQAYDALRQSGIKSQSARLNALAADLLGLARAQEAQGNLKSAAENFKRAQALAEIADMPRTFIDQARGGLAEVNQKLGTPAADDRQSEAAKLSPLPLTLLHQMPVRQRRQFIYRAPGAIANFSAPSMRDDTRLQEYLRLCAINYAEQTAGKNSSEAAVLNVELAQFYCDQQMFDLARTPAQHAVDIVANLKAADQRTVCQALLDLAARVAYSNGSDMILGVILNPSVLNVVATDQNDAVELSSKLSQVASAMQNKRDTAKAEVYQQQAVALLEKALPKDDVRLADERVKLAQLLSSNGKNSVAIELYELAIPSFESNAHDGRVVTNIAALINLYLNERRVDKVQPGVARLLQAMDKSPLDSTVSWSSVVLSLACNLVPEDKLDLVKQIYGRTFERLAQFEKLPTPRADFAYPTIRMLEQRLEEHGSIDEAENVYRSYMECMKSAQDSNSAAEAATELVRFYLRHDEYKKARAVVDTMLASVNKVGRSSDYYKHLGTLEIEFSNRQHNDDALAILQAELAVTDEEKGDVGRTVSMLTRAADLYDKTGDHTKAVAAAKRAEQVVLKHWPADFPNLNTSAAQLLDKQIGGGKLTEAKNLMQSLAQYESYPVNLTVPAFMTASVSRSLSMAFEQEQMFDQAIELERNRFDREVKQHGESSLQAATAMSSLSRALRGAGKGSEADKLDDEARAIQEAFARQQRGEAGAYSPFRPLSETMRNWKFQKLRPDSST